jgi:hypothetical protein
MTVLLLLVIRSLTIKTVKMFVYYLLAVNARSQDSLYFVNGKLQFDGTNKHVTVTGVNSIIFGDPTVTANENSDTLWDYVAYYNAGH